MKDLFAKYDDLVAGLSPEQEDGFHRGYLQASSDAVQSIDAIITGNLSDEEKFLELEAIVVAFNLVFLISGLANEDGAV